MYEFKLPDIGEGITEAQLMDWSVALGDRVEEGTEIATISTDKVDVELPSPRAGTIVELRWRPGDTIAVGEVLVRIDDGVEEAVEAAVEAAGAAAPAARKVAAREAAIGAPATARVVAAPSVRRLAKERGVELGTLAGSGGDGRILMRDVEAAIAAGEGTGAEQARPGELAARRQALPPARAVAAERLAYSVHTLATSTMSFEAAADGLRALTEKLAADAERRGVKLTPLALLAKCTAAALAEHPRFNATIDEESGELLLHAGVDLGIAVAAPAGLVVPVVRGVERRSLFEVALAVADVAERARKGRLEVADVRGGTFTLSSTGGLERAAILSTRPIVNPPQTAILWVSRIAERPRVKDGKLGAGPMLSCSLSFDHRYIDGAEATLFINDLAALIEDPDRALA